MWETIRIVSKCLHEFLYFLVSFLNYKRKSLNVFSFWSFIYWVTVNTMIMGSITNQSLADKARCWDPQLNTQCLQILTAYTVYTDVYCIPTAYPAVKNETGFLSSLAIRNIKRIINKRKSKNKWSINMTILETKIFLMIMFLYSVHIFKHIS